MEIELHPAASILPETFNALISPMELLAEALNSHPELQRYKILYICGNYSRILSRLDRNITVVGGAPRFTSFQLMTILEENHNSFLIVEHDPLLYEDAGHVVVHGPGPETDLPGRPPSCSARARPRPHLQKTTELADRVFCIYEGQAIPARGRTKTEARMPERGRR